MIAMTCVTGIVANANTAVEHVLNVGSQIVSVIVAIYVIRTLVNVSSR